MNTLYNVNDKVEIKVSGIVSRIEISENGEEYEIRIPYSDKVPMFAPVKVTKDQLLVMKSKKVKEKENGTR